MYDNEIDDYKIKCPICNKIYKEINNSHLKKHNLSPNEFDNLYPKSTRLSKTSLLNKNNYANITEDMRIKLKKSHSLEGYIEKYGEIEGNIKYNTALQNNKNGKSIDSYIKKYGDDALKIKKEHNKNKCVTLDKMIKKYGEYDGKIKYNKWLNSKSLSHYKLKYGDIEGEIKWINKNIKNSKSSKKAIDDGFESYTQQVRCFTELSVRLYGHLISNLNIRSLEYHLDHMVSILDGFNNKIDPKIIGSVYNLEIIHRSINCSKQHNSSLDLQQLIKLYLDSNEIDLYKIQY